MRLAPASRAFSTNSLTTDAGRSTTSPAAICELNSCGITRIGIGQSVKPKLTHVKVKPLEQAELMLNEFSCAPGLDMLFSLLTLKPRRIMSSPINYNRVFTSRGSAGIFLALTLLLAACGSSIATPAPTDTTVPTETSSATGLLGVFETSDASGVSIPAQIQVGDTWQQSFTMHGQMVIREGVTADANGTISQSFVATGLETVAVPAGSFEAMKVDTNIVFDLQLSMGGISLPMNFDAVSTNWWAPGIGWVKSDAAADLEGSDSIMWVIEL